MRTHPRAEADRHVHPGATQASFRAAIRALGLGIVLGLSACASGPSQDAGATAATPMIQPGAPGTASRTLTGEQRQIHEALPYTEADVRFMQNMIHHHAQAVWMSSLVPDRSRSEEIRLLARRIDRSQTDEIAFMERWLEERGEEVPEVSMGLESAADHSDHAAHAEQDPLMAGMLSPGQMERLAAAEAQTFDRLFLEAMIYHHEGALDMVSELFASPGAGQDSDIYQFASHVDGDQRIEIARMYGMLRGRG